MVCIRHTVNLHLNSNSDLAGVTFSVLLNMYSDNNYMNFSDDFLSDMKNEGISP